MLGRTYVHSTVYSIVLKAYEALEVSAPGKHFVYGETGKSSGGEFSPHKTHQNGLSVDFMVPLVDVAGKSVPMGTSVLNKWGYDLEVDRLGHLGDLTLDADAMAEHLYQLHLAAKEHGIDFWRVIFDPDLQPLLHKTARWEYLRDNVQFLQTRSWVRHDEHYHVDFEVSCGPAA
jgi:penicillin-insensitive murein endopeptidase